MQPKSGSFGPTRCLADLVADSDFVPSLLRVLAGELRSGSGSASWSPRPGEALSKVGPEGAWFSCRKSAASPGRQAACAARQATGREPAYGLLTGCSRDRRPRRRLAIAEVGESAGSCFFLFRRAAGRARLA